MVGVPESQQAWRASRRKKERLLIAASHLASITRWGGEMSLNCRAAFSEGFHCLTRELPPFTLPEASRVPFGEMASDETA